MSGNQKAWVGIDLGTQSVKVVAVTSEGEVLSHHAHPLTSTRDGDVHEQSPDEWIRATTQCLQMVTAELSPHFTVAGLSTCATSGTITVANRLTRNLRKVAVMYDDTRARDFTPQAQAAGQETWSRLGYTLQDSWALPAMAWWNSVDHLTDQDVFVTQADVIHWYLAGSPVASDSSHTLKAGFDLDQLVWPNAVFDSLGIPRSALNNVVTPGTVIGTVGELAAQETGLAQGTPIIAGMTDGSAAQIAAGAVEAGRWNSVLGTTLVLKGASTHRHFDSTEALYCHLAPFGSGWWPGGASNTGTRALNDLLPDQPLDSFRLTPSLIAATPVRYPLVGVGERFPFVHSEATEFIVEEPGEDWGDTALHIFASITLGVALVERLALDVVSSAGYLVDGPVSLTGGASANREWNQLRATVLNRTCEVPRNTDSAFGMAILARAGEEARVPVDFAHIVSSMVTPEVTFTPDSGLRKVVDQKYATLLDQLQARRWISPELAQFAKGNRP
jgi:sugar (pentulose or hexulose) kinase